MLFACIWKALLFDFYPISLCILFFKQMKVSTPADFESQNRLNQVEFNC